jgi:hypothetical protein
LRPSVGICLFLWIVTGASGKFKNYNYYNPYKRRNKMVDQKE